MRMSRMNLVAGCVLAVALGCFLHPSTALGFEIVIDVAPNVLNIQSESKVVTVHTDIAYSLVVGSSVYLNGVRIDHWKSDNRGNFVAKFLAEDIKSLDELVIGDYNILTLVGSMIDGSLFEGTQDILVISVIPSGK